MLRLAEILRARRDEIVRRWEHEVREDPAVPEAERLPPPRLRDHVPALVDAIAEALVESAGSGVPEAQLGRDFGARALPFEHAVDRVDAGYSLAATLRELSHLRAVMVDVWCCEENLDSAGVRLVHAALDECMATAAVYMDRLTNAALRRERDRLDRVLEMLPVGVFLCDERGAEIASNEAFRAIWGDPSKAVSRWEDYDAYVAFEPGGRRIRAEEWGLAVALRTGRTVRNQELEIVTFGGERRSVFNSASALVDEEGRIMGGLAVVVDATETLTALRRLREEGELRDAFMGILGHDLRNPLSTIRMASAMLLQGELDEGSAGYVRRVSRATERMTRMIEDLLDFTRARGGALPLAPRADDLWDLVEEVVDELRIANPRRKVSLDVQGSGVGRWDRDRLHQVFANLLSNALAYSPSDSTVRVSAEAVGARVRVQFHNVGPVIPADTLEHLFEPFRRGPTSDGSTGLGLGLFIAREIVTAHGGAIVAKSSPEEGTSFDVLLPRDPPRA